MSAPERAGSSEDPPDRRRSWAPPASFWRIIAVLVTFIGAVATVIQLIEFILSSEINVLAFSVIIVSFVIVVTYLFSVKGGKVALISVGTVLILIFVTLFVIELVLPLRFPSTLDCDKIASPDGSDTNEGNSPESPVQTVGQLVTLLAPSQTGCLRAGTYTFDEIELAAEHIRVSSYPGEQATIVGHLIISGSGSAVENLKMDASSSGASEAIIVATPDAKIRGNEITNSKKKKGDNLAVCIRAVENSHRLTVEGNRIHNCGLNPPDNNGVAIQIRYANGALIRNNFIYDNVDDAIELYPAAQHSIIMNNTIDGNGGGIKFAGSDDYNDAIVSSYNIVENNIITNSIIDWNIQDYWGEPGHEHFGVGNIARSNCVLGTNQNNKEFNTNGGVFNTNGGALRGSFVAKDNLIVDPQYIDRAKKDFRIAEGSPCAGKGVSPS